MKDYSEDGILIRLDDGFDTDCRLLAEKLRQLCTDCIAPDGTEPVGSNPVWGQSTFGYNGMFVKAHYECVQTNKLVPFAWADRVEEGVILAISKNIPTAEYVGRFAVRCGDEWEWSGMLHRFLYGYRELTESSEDVDCAVAAIDLLRFHGIVHPDVHAGNLLVKDKDLRIVDLIGCKECEPGDRNAAAQMAQKYLSMLKSGDAKSKVEAYIHGL